MSDYSEKLKDPRWQKKRLEILQRDNFTCQYCGDTKATLAVHHKDYFPNIEPWDCPDDLLITLCEECHKLELENDSKPTEQLIIHEMRRIFNGDDLYNIYECFKNIPPLNPADSWMLSETINWAFGRKEIREELINRVSKLMMGETNAKG